MSRIRKFFYDDTAVITWERTGHTGHTGRIIKTTIKVSANGRRKAYYRVTCECGPTITLESVHMEHPETLVPTP